MWRNGLLLLKWTCRGSAVNGFVFFIPLYVTVLPDFDALMPFGWEYVSTFSLASFTEVDCVSTTYGLMAWMVPLYSTSWLSY